MGLHVKLDFKKTEVFILRRLAIPVIVVSIMIIDGNYISNFWIGLMIFGLGFFLNYLLDLILIAPFIRKNKKDL